MESLDKVLEAILFASNEPIPVDKIAKSLGKDRSDVNVSLERLCAEYEGHGVELLELAEGFVMATREEVSPEVGKFFERVKRIRLSKPALETLSIVVYRQPLTKSEVEQIRGVDADGVLKTLMERDFVRITGRKDEPGNPLLYGSTPNFLKSFGLRDLSELPTWEEIMNIIKAEAEGQEEVEWTIPQDLSELQEKIKRERKEMDVEIQEVDEVIQSIEPPKFEDDLKAMEKEQQIQEQ